MRGGKNCCVREVNCIGDHGAALSAWRKVWLILAWNTQVPLCISNDPHLPCWITGSPFSVSTGAHGSEIQFRSD